MTCVCFVPGDISPNVDIQTRIRRNRPGLHREKMSLNFYILFSLKFIVNLQYETLFFLLVIKPLNILQQFSFRTSIICKLCLILYVKCWRNDYKWKGICFMDVRCWLLIFYRTNLTYFVPRILAQTCVTGS